MDFIKHASHVDCMYSLFDNPKLRIMENLPLLSLVTWHEAQANIRYSQSTLKVTVNRNSMEDAVGITRYKQGC